MTSNSSSIPVTLKWNKQTFHLEIQIGEKALTFKERVQETTGVPVERQKLLAASKKGWKGPLSSDFVLGSVVFKDPSSTLNVTLIGSAETLATKPKDEIKFVEDMSPEDLARVEHEQAQAAMGMAVGMIQALQLPPHRRDDKKQETYHYNRLVSGLPQRQIEQELKYRQRQQQRNRKEIKSEDDNESSSNNRNGEETGDISMQGKVAMQLGLELRRAYINDLAVLEDGTIVSVFDDGHVQLWRNAAQQQDVVHQGISREGGVDSVVALNPKNSVRAAFATAGRGGLQLWTADADPILILPGAMPGTSPASLQSVFGGFALKGGSSGDDSGTGGILMLAARLEITRQSDPSQFRLPPQNEVERQRRAYAEAQERAVQEALAKRSRSLQVWFSTNGPINDASISSKILQPPMGGFEGTAPITCLTTTPMHGTADSGSIRVLLAGDSAGGIRLWKAHHNEKGDVEFSHLALLQLVPNSAGGSDDAVPSSSCSIVCMEPLSNGRLAVSTESKNVGPLRLAGATPVPLVQATAVHVVNLLEFLAIATADLATTMETIPSIIIQTTLTGHTRDSVICMCELPDGAFMTGGGRLDATLQIWSKSQIHDGRCQPHEEKQEQQSTEQGDQMVIEDNNDANAQRSENTIVQSKACKILTGDVGYVFGLAVLPDAKDESEYYAVAVARYNTIKIII